MHLIVAYDVSSPRKSVRIRKLLKRIGVHSQKSVFECEIASRSVFDTLRARLSSILEEEDAEDGSGDSVLLYPLCMRCARSVLILGQGIPVLSTDWSIL